MAETIEGPELFARDAEGNLTPVGQAQRWTLEFATARQRLKSWQEKGEKILDRYLDERNADSSEESRLNLFTANVETQHAMLYGKIPTADVGREFEDEDDDDARIASTMLERVIRPRSTNDTYSTALAYALEDRLLTGLGFASVRYELETEDATDEAGQPILDDAGSPVPRKVRESAETDYHYWKSVLWSPARTFEEWRWAAWAYPMTREDMQKRFGEIAALVPLNTGTGKKTDPDAVKANPYATADVWEIWCKQDRKVYWYVEGFAQILDQKDDPLGLEGFYPFPRPLVARPTTRSFVPRPDFLLAQDLYNEIDVLSTRINLLEKAVRVAGVYDKSSPEVAKLLTDAGFNKLYPAEDWSSLSEKGGLGKAVDWFPLDAVTNAIAVLTEKRAEKIGLLQQVTGWSDIMRGQSSASETLGAQKLKAQYGSVRIAKFQGEFAKFASDLQAIRAEIVCKHFDPETIIRLSNIRQSVDAKDYAGPNGQVIPGSGEARIQRAVALLKQEGVKFRVEVKPENINLTDYAQLKQERTEVVEALGGLIAAGTPLVQAVGPTAADFILAAGAWLLAGTKGGDSLESEFDAFRSKVQALANQPPAPPQPDPTAVVKAQAEMGKAQATMEQTQMDSQAARERHAMDMEKLRTQTAARVVESTLPQAQVPVIATGGN